MLEFDFYALTDKGMSRDNNEDSVTFDGATRLGVLADGMGGYNAGEVASAMATTFIRSELARWLAQASNAAPKDIRRAMEICVTNANLSIFNAATSNPQYNGMGTTLVLGAFTKEHLVLGHIGDSRAYLWRQGKLEQVTRDHSLIQEQIDAGLITPEEAEHSTQKNLVTRALGVDHAVELEVHDHPIAIGDIWLFCSDGLSDMIGAPQIASVLELPVSLQQKAERLIGLANANGGVDNISVFLAEIRKSAQPKGFLARLLGK
jgi:PPM family protein phosphatase